LVFMVFLFVGQFELKMFQRANGFNQKSFFWRANLRPAGSWANPFA